MTVFFKKPCFCFRLGTCLYVYVLHVFKARAMPRTVIFFEKCCIFFLFVGILRCVYACISISVFSRTGLCTVYDYTRSPTRTCTHLTVAAKRGCIYICMYLCMYPCMHTSFMYLCMYVCIYPCMYVCTHHLCTYSCMYVCMYVCIHIEHPQKKDKLTVEKKQA